MTVGGQSVGEEPLAAESARPPTHRDRVLHGAVAGSHVRDLQQTLLENDFSPGPVDGVYGPQTAHAVRAFQQEHDLEVDGVVGPSTWRALEEGPTGERLRRTRLRGSLFGATGGEDVLEAQRILARAGHDPGALDAVYGPHTKRAVVAFQREQGLDPDGVVGPDTWAALRRIQRRNAKRWRQPNPSVARDYWTTDDSLAYGDYAKAIAAFILHEDTLPPLTIGIKGPWGAGKTSVMRMVQKELDPPLNPHASEWKFLELELTDAGWHALTKEGEPPADSDSTTVKTVLDRAAKAPALEPDLREPVATHAVAKKSRGMTIRRPTVWFNPWMYQTGEQVWAGLAHEIISQVTNRLTWGQRQRFWLELNLRRVNREALRHSIYELGFRKLLVPLAIFLGAVAGAATLALFGVAWAALFTSVPAGGTALVLGVSQLGRLLKKDAATAFPWLVEGPIGLPTREGLTEELRSWNGLVTQPDYQARAGFLYFLQADVKHVLDLVATPTSPLVVFVDDLDRCSPGVVTQTIEAVNLFLAGEFPNCIFVLAIEPAVVAAHIESAHKELVDKLDKIGLAEGWSQLGWRFLEKIVQLPLGLPPPRASTAREYVVALFGGAAAGNGAAESRGEGASLLSEEVHQAADAEFAELEKSQGQPNLATIPVERDRVEERLLETKRFDAVLARKVADEVAIRRFESSYSDNDEQVRDVLVQAALALPNRNPREMKRLVNLFRFYALIVNRRGILVEAASQADVFSQVARLAALAIRWPQLLTVFGKPVDRIADDNEQPKVALEELEKAAAAPDDLWEEALSAHGVVRPDAAGEPQGLRAFLCDGVSIGPIARELL